MVAVERPTPASGYCPPDRFSPRIFLLGLSVTSVALSVPTDHATNHVSSSPGTTWWVNLVQGLDRTTLPAHIRSSDRSGRKHKPGGGAPSPQALREPLVLANDPLTYTIPVATYEAAMVATSAFGCVRAMCTEYTPSIWPASAVISGAVQA